MKSKVNGQAVTDVISSFITYIAKVLPDDVTAKLEELRADEANGLPSLIYDTMFKNQELARLLDRPSCQDTGVIQFFASVGTAYPLIDALPDMFINAVLHATKEAPLRHNAVETFDEYNTGNNTGYRVPCVDWEIVPNNDELTLGIYMAGGGCTLPGKAMVLMPGAGYEGVVEFVLDVITSYGLNACPPLLVGVGVATSVETAARLSKKALLRPVGSKNPNERAAMLETELEDGINSIGLGPQGLSGSKSVMGVHIENAARHPSAIGVAVNVGCWSHRRGCIHFRADGTYEIISHKGARL
jgi:L(+)-tartrate dehydratase alpha subunit